MVGGVTGEAEPGAAGGGLLPLQLQALLSLHCWEQESVNLAFSSLNLSLVGFLISSYVLSFTSKPGFTRRLVFIPYHFIVRPMKSLLAQR